MTWTGPVDDKFLRQKLLILTGGLMPVSRVRPQQASWKDTNWAEGDLQ
jgi:hypothetical protein